WLRALSRSLPGTLGKIALGLARHAAKALDAAQPANVRADGPLLVVPAGDIAHVYSTEVPEPCLEPELRARHPGLLERCANSPVVGVTLVRTAMGPIALRNGRRFELERTSDAAEVSRLVGHPLAATYCKDLLALRSAGDVVLIGAGGGRTVAYPWEFGSHGGLAAEEVETFVVHPAALGENAFAHVVRPLELYSFFRARSLEWRSEERRAVAR
ncbi:MAG TPA: hypothetical protein VE620_13650, partial [Myxococcales bacterium]|nr:hypothetical protein [Myxococcales bacterium]